MGINSSASWLVGTVNVSVGTVGYTTHLNTEKTSNFEGRSLISRLITMAVDKVWLQVVYNL